MESGWRIGVVIPAKNEEAHIKDVLETLPDWIDCAVVVNDGSTDNTGQVAKMAQTTCETFHLDGGGQGVGAAIDMGHQHLLGHFAEPFISVVMAGDGQMDPSDIPSLIAPIIVGLADHVKGNREVHNEGFNRMPQSRQRASKVLSWLTTLAAGQPIGDPQCGFTATSYRVLRTWNWNRSWKGYGYPNFWLINLSKVGWRIHEMPVKSIYRNEVSGIKPLSFFSRVGVMMTVEFHRRNLSWLLPGSMLPHTWFALMAYLLGWSALLPTISNDLEHVLLERGVPAWILVLAWWTLAHLFDRSGTRTRRELHTYAPP
jgi:glycosyltransferase involved in cell wall biosynthesis